MDTNETLTPAFELISASAKKDKDILNALAKKYAILDIANATIRYMF